MCSRCRSSRGALTRVGESTAAAERQVRRLREEIPDELRYREELGERRARQAMRAPVADALRLDGSHGRANDLVVLVGHLVDRLDPVLGLLGERTERHGHLEDFLDPLQERDRRPRGRRLRDVVRDGGPEADRRQPRGEGLRFAVVSDFQRTSRAEVWRHLLNGAGFKHVEYMSVVFKKKVGMPPSEYRDRRGR